MKKYVILFLMGAMFFCVESVHRIRQTNPWKDMAIKTYEQLKSIFIKDMYDVSGKVIPFKEYELLGNNFIKQAEDSNLASIRYCEEHPQKQLAHLFLQNIISYAVGDFNNQLGYTSMKPSDAALKALLEDIQEKVKEKFNVDSELVVLVQLIQSANKAYYKTFPWYTRLVIRLFK